jgi:membrane associated rhomboid family serine protease
MTDPGPARILRLRRGGSVELRADGFRHPRSPHLPGAAFTRYEDVTHLVCTTGGLRVGSRGGSLLLRRSDFAERGAHAELAAELRRRIAGSPGGPAQLARMGRLDAFAARPGGIPLTHALAALCIALFGLERLAPSYYATGFFSTSLVALGEPWRLVTGNLLHASLLHLALNVVGIGVLGGLAERSFGTRGLAPIVALAGLGAMLGSYAAGYEVALGASGLVAGLAGALLWLEFRAPETVPVVWRLPRRAFVGVVLLEGVGLLALPGIAHAAHAGGFLAGVLGAGAVGPRLETAGRARRGLAVLNGLTVLALLLAGAAWVQSVRAPDPEALARRGEGLLHREEVSADFLNDEAWRIATSPGPSSAALDVARRMAERAADETGWAEPAILDTLAEVHFLAGRPQLAQELARAAVALAPDNPYYREQLERFRRPAPEIEPEAPAPERAAPGPGLRV